MSIYQHFEAILVQLRALPKSKAREQALLRLEECSFWTSAAVTGVESPIEYTSNDPSEIEAAVRRLLPKKPS